MIVIRRAQLSDLDVLMRLSHEVGVGMTAMPTNEANWQKKLVKTDVDFDKSIEQPNGDIYFMVLADNEQAKVEHVKSIRQSKIVNIARVEKIPGSNEGCNPYIMSKQCLKNYRLLEQPVQFLSDQEVVISSAATEVLKGKAYESLVQ